MIRKKPLVMYLLFIVFIVGVKAASIYLTIPTTGNIKDYKLEASPSSFSWGNTTLGVMNNQTIQIKNVGTKTVTNLYVDAVNVVGLNNYSLTCSLEGQSIAPDETKNCVFTLTVYNYTADTFSFDINVHGEP
jgi:hypothetical protein